MQVIERDVLVDPNESGDYWYIPVTFYNANGIKIDTSAYSYTVVADAWNTECGVEDSETVQGWIDIQVGDILGVQIPTSVDFGQFLLIRISIVDSYDLDQDSDTTEIVSQVTLNIRKMASGGSGGGSGSSSSISVPTAPEIAAAVWNYSNPTPASGTLGTRTLSSTVEVDPDDIAEAVWNYGAEEGDETIADRTLSTTVEVNPSAIAQAVWNYADANPASGTLGTRTLTTAIPTAANIATAVLTTDVGTMVVGTDDYTVKHLIMASQKSEVVTDNGATVWKIRDERLDPETDEATVIASRTLTINSNGAIVKTE